MYIYSNTLTPQIKGKSQCINLTLHWLWNVNEIKCGVRYILYCTHTLISAFQNNVTVLDAENETTTILYRCTDAILIMGFSFLNLIFIIVEK